MRRLLAAAWWCVLSIWLVCAVAPGVVAISAFTTLPSLGITVTDAHAFLGDRAAANGRFAAGYVTDPVFQVSDIVQLALSVLGVILFAVGGARFPSSTRFSRVLTGIALALAVGLTGVIAIGISPPMNRHLTAYRAAATLNNADVAVRELAAFNILHPTAERLHAIRAAAVLGLIVVCGFASGRTTPPTETPS